MRYPTLTAVNNAHAHKDVTQLARWHRFLPSPGMNALDARIEGEGFYLIQKDEVNVMNHIAQCLKELGGITPEISKTIGWTPAE